MKNPSISIIVPANNVEGYLPSCLNSLIGQTFGDFEIICINDGSTDGSLSVLESFAKKDSRILVVNEKEKIGQAAARNIGIALARGEYIGFVDGDDWVEPDMFEKLYESAKIHDSDITMCATHLHNDYTETSSHDSPYYNLNVFNDSFDNRSFSAEETTDFILSINVAIWNKIYKKAFLNKIGARFSEGYIYEDLPFFYETYLKAEKITLVRNFLYFYRMNRVGSTMSNLGEKVLDRIDMVSLTYELFKKLPYYKKIEQKVVGWIIDDLFHRYTLIDKRYQKEFYFKMQKLFRSIEIDDEEKLRFVYCYEEFLLVKKETYESCNRILFTKYKDSKKMVHETKFHTENQLYEKSAYYESKLKEQTLENAIILEEKLRDQKSWFEKTIEIELKNLGKILEANKQNELSLQKEYYENENQRKLDNQKDWFEEELNRQTKDHIAFCEKQVREKLKENNEYHEQQLCEKFKENNEYHQLQLDEKLKENNDYHKKQLSERLEANDEYHERQLNENLKENNELHEQQLYESLENQKNWFEEDFERTKKEIDHWHESNLQKQLLDQKNIYDDQIEKLRKEYSEYIHQQKTAYENEIQQVRFALKVVKKLKKIKRSLIK